MTQQFTKCLVVIINKWYLVWVRLFYGLSFPKCITLGLCKAVHWCAFRAAPYNITTCYPFSLWAWNKSRKQVWLWPGFSYVQFSFPGTLSKTETQLGLLHGYRWTVQSPQVGCIDCWSQRGASKRCISRLVCVNREKEAPPGGKPTKSCRFVCSDTLR